jgi:V8-like Glu-specific endopeptidase
MDFNSKINSANSLSLYHLFMRWFYFNVLYLILRVHSFIINHLFFKQNTIWHMSDFLSLISNAEKRYYNKNIDVEGVLKKIRAIKKRAANADGGNTTETGSLADEITKERILGDSDFLHISYLEKGLKAAKTVGRIVIKNKLGDVQGHGTGFLISPGLLLTNNHVIDSEKKANFCEVEFDYEYSITGKEKNRTTFKFEPETYFITSPEDELDYTLLLVKEKDLTDSVCINAFGYMPLLVEDGAKLKVGQCLTIIQHPRGELKQIAVRENKLIDVDADGNFLRYQTDTAPGSSGSMVANDHWEVVGLHHSGVPKRDAGGNILAKSEVPWDETTMKEEDIWWIANEGIKITSILSDIERQQHSKTKELLITF